jgi:glycine dehydrogenase subunit 1
MDFISNQEEQRREMLDAIGVSRIEDLLKDIPASLLLPVPKDEDGLSEYEGYSILEALSKENKYPELDSYLGAGAYRHHIPAIVSAITSRSEFLTSYTPYQAEASQGLLQAIFEYQTAISSLTGMDASNASVYDGASACAEACLMAMHYKEGNKKVAISETVHPLYREVVKLYLEGIGAEIELIPMKDGVSDFSKLQGPFACLLMQSPNFFGFLEKKPSSLDEIAILCSNPLSYGLLPSAKEQGADIAVGDLQPFGVPLSFGGPYSGYIACREPFLRKLPGRIVGRTNDAEGNTGYVLTLQAREQHIRREKATSNICTNQALTTIAALVAMLWYGPEGMKKWALTNYQRTHYLRKLLPESPFKAQADFFNEFPLSFSQPLEKVINHFRNEGIDPGLPLEKFFPTLSHSLLVNVTELKSKNQLDRFAEIARRLK